MRCNVALVDDHHLMRAGLLSTVNAMSGYRVSLEAGHGQELVDQLSQMVPDDPDMPRIAIVDLSMPVMDGFATIAWLRANAPTILPMALTFDGGDDAMVRAVQAGARGFVLKTVRPAVLRTALDSIRTTGYYNGQLPADEPSEAWKAFESTEREREHILAQITPREMEFLALVCDEAELTYEEIAERMGTHRRTVEVFRNGLAEKFHIKSKTGLVLFALRWKLVLPK